MTVYNLRSRERNVVVIKPAMDMKAGRNVISRVPGLKLEVDHLLSRSDNVLEVVGSKFSKCQFVMVDEAQFLSVEHVNQLLELVVVQGVYVICYGLRMDRFGEPFPGSSRLLSIADDLKEIVTVCQCGVKATKNGSLKDGKLVVDDGVAE